jgi:hypothetical protein
MKLSGAQKLVKWFSSASRFEKIMNESKQWKFTCDCGQVSSVWDTGGVRSGASGNPKVAVKCPHCGKKSIQKISKES